MTNRKLHALSIDTKIDDLGWPWTVQVRIVGEFRRISQNSDATTAKWMKKTSIVSDNVECNWRYFSTLCSLRLFAVDFFTRGLHTRTDVFSLRFSRSNDFTVFVNRLLWGGERRTVLRDENKLLYVMQRLPWVEITKRYRFKRQSTESSQV